MRALLKRRPESTPCSPPRISWPPGALAVLRRRPAHPRGHRARRLRRLPRGRDGRSRPHQRPPAHRGDGRRDDPIAHRQYGPVERDRAPRDPRDELIRASVEHGRGRPLTESAGTRRADRPVVRRDVLTVRHRAGPAPEAGRIDPRHSLEESRCTDPSEIRASRGSLSESSSASSPRPAARRRRPLLPRAGGRTAAAATASQTPIPTPVHRPDHARRRSRPAPGPTAASSSAGSSASAPAPSPPTSGRSRRASRRTTRRRRTSTSPSRSSTTPWPRASSRPRSRPATRPDIIGPVGIEGLNLFRDQLLDLAPLIAKTNYTSARRRSQSSSTSSRSARTAHQIGAALRRLPVVPLLQQGSLRRGQAALPADQGRRAVPGQAVGHGRPRAAWP